MSNAEHFTDEIIAWIVDRQLSGATATEVAQSTINQFGLKIEVRYYATRIRANARRIEPVLLAAYRQLMEKQKPEVRALFEREPYSTLTPLEVSRVIGQSPEDGDAVIWLIARYPEARHFDYFRYLINPLTRFNARTVQLIVMGRDAQQTGDEIVAAIYRDTGIALANGGVIANIVSHLRAHGYKIPESTRSATAQRAASLIAAKKNGTAKTKENFPLPKHVRAPVKEETTDSNKPALVLVKNPNMPEPVEPPPPSRDRPGVKFFELRDSAVRKQCRFPLWNHTERLPLEQLRFCGAAHTNSHAYCTECSKGLFLAARARLR